MLYTRKIDIIMSLKQFQVLYVEVATGCTAAGANLRRIWLETNLKRTCEENDTFKFNISDEINGNLFLLEEAESIRRFCDTAAHAGIER